MHRRVGIFSENKKKQGLVVTERDPSDHTAGLIVHHIDIFIARPVAGRFECSDDIAQALFKAVLRIKHQATDAGVQAIGAHNKVEPPLGAGCEPHTHMSFLIVDFDYLIAKDRLDVAVYLFKQKLRKGATTNRYIASARQFEKNACAEARDSRALSVNNSHVPDVVAGLIDLFDQAHALGDIVAQAPKIDDITATAQRGCVLDDRRLETSCFQPVGKR